MTHYSQKKIWCASFCLCHDHALKLYIGWIRYFSPECKTCRKLSLPSTMSNTSTVAFPIFSKRSSLPWSILSPNAARALGVARPSTTRQHSAVTNILVVVARWDGGTSREVDELFEQENHELLHVSKQSACRTSVVHQFKLCCNGALKKITMLE